MKTRFKEIDLENFDKNLWMFTNDGSQIGQHYRTKNEALCDLQRFAYEYGLNAQD